VFLKERAKLVVIAERVIGWLAMTRRSRMGVGLGLGVASMGRGVGCDK